MRENGKTRAKAKAKANAASRRVPEKLFLLALLSLFVFIPSLFFRFYQLINYRIPPTSALAATVALGFAFAIAFAIVFFTNSAQTTRCPEQGRKLHLHSPRRFQPYFAFPF